MVNRVLDILQERNLLYAPEYDDEDGDTTTGEPQKRTHRDHVIAELVSTERKYVQDLESLQQFKSLVQEKGVISGDVIHNIFLNLDSLLDFQRRFLIRIETVNSMPPALQNWGLLFVQNQEAFQVYQPFIANQKRCEETAMREFDRLATVGSGVTHDRTTLSAFLLKPFQRLTKYPMFLKVCRLCSRRAPESDFAIRIFVTNQGRVRVKNPISVPDSTLLRQSSKKQTKPSIRKLEILLSKNLLHMSKIGRVTRWKDLVSCCSLATLQSSSTMERMMLKKRFVLTFLLLENAP